MSQPFTSVTKTKSIMKEVKQKHTEYIKYMYPNVPEHALPPMPKYLKSAKSSNELTKAIITYCLLKGWQAERISSSGRVINQQKQVTDVLGRTKTIGSAKYIKSTSQNGTADISTTIDGKSVKIEVKYAGTKDKMSASQRKYKQMIESAGGIYFVARTLKESVEFLDTFNDNKNKTALWDLHKAFS